MVFLRGPCGVLVIMTWFRISRSPVVSNANRQEEFEIWRGAVGWILARWYAACRRTHVRDVLLDASSHRKLRLKLSKTTGQQPQAGGSAGAVGPCARTRPSLCRKLGERRQGRLREAPAKSRAQQ